MNDGTFSKKSLGQILSKCEYFKESNKCKKCNNFNINENYFCCLTCKKRYCFSCLQTFKNNLNMNIGCCRNSVKDFNFNKFKEIFECKCNNESHLFSKSCVEYVLKNDISINQSNNNQKEISIVECKNNESLLTSASSIGSANDFNFLNKKIKYNPLPKECIDDNERNNLEISIDQAFEFKNVSKKKENLNELEKERLEIVYEKNQMLEKAKENVNEIEIENEKMINKLKNPSFYLSSIGRVNLFEIGEYYNICEENILNSIVEYFHWKYLYENLKMKMNININPYSDNNKNQNINQSIVNGMFNISNSIINPEISIRNNVLELDFLYSINQENSKCITSTMIFSINRNTFIILVLFDNRDLLYSNHLSCNVYTNKNIKFTKLKVNYDKDKDNDVENIWNDSEEEGNPPFIFSKVAIHDEFESMNQLDKHYESKYNDKDLKVYYYQHNRNVIYKIIFQNGLPNSVTMHKVNYNISSLSHNSNILLYWNRHENVLVKLLDCDICLEKIKTLKIKSTKLFGLSICSKFIYFAHEDQGKRMYVAKHFTDDSKENVNMYEITQKKYNKSFQIITNNNDPSILIFKGASLISIKNKSLIEMKSKKLSLNDFRIIKKIKKIDKYLNRQNRSNDLNSLNDSEHSELSSEMKSDKKCQLNLELESNCIKTNIICNDKNHIIVYYSCVPYSNLLKENQKSQYLNKIVIYKKYSHKYVKIKVININEELKVREDDIDIGNSKNNISKNMIRNMDNDKSINEILNPKMINIISINSVVTIKEKEKKPSNYYNINMIEDDDDYDIDMDKSSKEMLKELHLNIGTFRKMYLLKIEIH